MVLKQVGKSANSTANDASKEEFATAIADKTHLANLITSLKSELASANAILKIKEQETKEAKEQLKRTKDDLSGANKRVELLEKQCETYRQTVWILYLLQSLACFVFFQMKITFFIYLDQTLGGTITITFRYNKAVRRNAIDVKIGKSNRNF